MLNEQKLSQHINQLFLYTTEKTNVNPSCHAKTDLGSLIEDETDQSTHLHDAATGGLALSIAGRTAQTCDKSSKQRGAEAGEWHLKTLK